MALSNARKQELENLRQSLIKKTAKRLGVSDKNLDTAVYNYDQMLYAIRQAESDDNYEADSPRSTQSLIKSLLGKGKILSSAKGAYQVVKGSVRPAYNRVTRLAGVDIPEYSEVLETQDVSTLEPVLQDLLITADLLEKTIKNKEGTLTKGEGDRLLKRVFSGDKQAALDMWVQGHHTIPRKYDKKNTDRIIAYGQERFDRSFSGEIIEPEEIIVKKEPEKKEEEIAEVLTVEPEPEEIDFVIEKKPRRSFSIISEAMANDAEIVKIQEKQNKLNKWEDDHKDLELEQYMQDWQTFRNTLESPQLEKEIKKLEENKVTSKPPEEQAVEIASRIEREENPLISAGIPRADDASISSSVPRAEDPLISAGISTELPVPSTALDIERYREAVGEDQFARPTTAIEEKPPTEDILNARKTITENFERRSPILPAKMVRTYIDEERTKTNNMLPSTVEVQSLGINYDDYISYDANPEERFKGVDFSRRFAYGAAREQMFLTNVYDVVSAGVKAISSSDVTYDEALKKIKEKDLEKIYKEFPEFRGVSLYDEDAAMIGGRVGVAFVDPIAWAIPWTRIAKAGKLYSASAGAGFGAADMALWGEVNEGSVDPYMVAVGAAFGGTTNLIADVVRSRFLKNRSAKNEKIADDIEASVKESDDLVDEIETLAANGVEMPNAPKIVDGPVPDMRPLRELIKEHPYMGGGERNPINKLPADASHSEIVRAHREFILGGRPYEVARETVNYISDVAEDLSKAGSNFVPNPKIGIELTEELQSMIGLSRQIKTVRAKINDLKIKKGSSAQKEVAPLQKQLDDLQEQLGSVSVRNFNTTLDRRLDAQDLAEAVADVAIKEERLSSGMLQYLIREGTRPTFGALGGWTASHYFLDEDDGYGYTLGWMAAGAGLMSWHKWAANRNISTLNKDTLEMTVQRGFRDLLAAGNLKFLTASTASTKLDSLGGVGKVVANLLFDRPGGATKSVESTSFSELTKWNQRLGETLGRSRADSDVLRAVGETLNGFTKFADLRVGYRGVANDFSKGLTQAQINEVKRITNSLEQQRDDLAQSINAIGIDFKKLKNYGMPQLYDTKAIANNPTEFKRIIAEGEFNGDLKKAENLFEKMFFKNFDERGLAQHYDEQSVIGQDFKFRPLLDHFEKERFIKDAGTRKRLAERGFIDLDAKKVFSIYGQKSINIREFARVFGPNGEFIQEAFKIVDKSFDSSNISRTSKEYRTYRNYMRDSVNAFFGKYGQNFSGHVPPASIAAQGLVALANMAYLPRVTITALADFMSPFKSTSIKAASQAVFNRSPHSKAGLKYNDDFELEFRALMAQSNDPLSATTNALNNWQRFFFKAVGLKKVTEVAGRYAFDAGAFRAFEVAEKLGKNKKISKGLQREIKEMGVQNDDLIYLSRFQNVNEAFDDEVGKEILTRAGMKVMDRDRLVPKVGNRLLFTQHRDPVIRQLGQFMSWTQAKTSQTNALIKRIEDGDVKLFARILGANVIGNGAIQFLRDVAKPTYDPDEENPFVNENYFRLDNARNNFLFKTSDLSGEFNNWFLSRMASTFKYNVGRGDDILLSSSASLSYGADAVGAVASAYNNLVEDGDWEGALEDVANLLPYIGEINKQLKEKTDLSFPFVLRDRVEGRRTEYFNPSYYAKGGVVDVAGATSEPDERIDKMTGLPYNLQAGTLGIDEEDPEKRLMSNQGGRVLGSLRQRKMSGALVRRAVDKFQEVLEKAGKTQDDLKPKILYDNKGVEKAKPKGIFSTDEVITPDPIKKETWKKQQEGFKQEQDPDVAKAALDLDENIIDEVQYDKIVREKLPVQRKEKLEAIPTDEDIAFSLAANKINKGIVGKNVFIKDGTSIQTRLDIPSYNDYGKWIVSIHDRITKDSVAYGKTAILNNVTFLTSPKAALGVAKLKNVKSTFARMEGKWQNATTEEASELAENILKGIKEGDETWIQVGFNPYRHSFFYDEKTMEPLLGAEQVIQIGKLVFAKGAKKTHRMDEAFTVKRKGKKPIKFNTGGKVLRALANTRR